MSDTSISATQPQPGDRLWADWVTVWQSELAALAADREVQEAAQRAVDLWAAAALAAGGDPAGRTGAPAPPGTAAPAAAPDRQPLPPSDRRAAAADPD